MYFIFGFSDKNFILIDRKIENSRKFLFNNFKFVSDNKFLMNMVVKRKGVFKNFLSSTLLFYNFFDFYSNLFFNKTLKNNKILKSYNSFLDLKLIFKSFFKNFKSKFFFNPLKKRTKKKYSFLLNKKYLIKKNIFLFQSKFLRKSRLYFFFKFFFKSKKILTSFFSKSSFFKDNLKKDKFEKGFFVSDRQMEIPLNFFLI